MVSSIVIALVTAVIVFLLIVAVVAIVKYQDNKKLTKAQQQKEGVTLGAFKDIPVIMWILQALVTFAITIGTYKSFFGAYFCSIMIVVLLSIALKHYTSKYLFEGIANARQGKDY